MRVLAVLAVTVALTGCGRQEPASPPVGQTASQPATPSSAPIAGRHTFAIVPRESKAMYHADEEFFAGALKKLGIAAGKRKVVGTTQAIEGQFQLDPAKPAEGLGTNSFTVRMNTFTTE